MGYRPNKLARGLATGRLGRFGLLVPDVVNPFFAEVLRTVQHAAAASDGSLILVADSDESAGAEPDLLKVLADDVDGVILASPRAKAGILQEAAASVACVVINRVLANTDSVTCSYGDAVVAAGNHLAAAEHRLIALVRGPSSSWAATQRAQALRRWAKLSNASVVEIGSVPATYEGGMSAVAAIVKSGATAVVAYDDLVASGVIAGLHELGRQVPEDISVVGCDDTVLARILTPALTTIRTPYTEIGRQAVALLNRRIADRDAPAMNVNIPCDLVVRDSTAPARTSR
jgi:DNA-binding LacI/PurR family transcriptional regulator